MRHSVRRTGQGRAGGVSAGRWLTFQGCPRAEARAVPAPRPASNVFGGFSLFLPRHQHSLRHTHPLSQHSHFTSPPSTCPTSPPSPSLRHSSPSRSPPSRPTPSPRSLQRSTQSTTHSQTTLLLALPSTPTPLPRVGESCSSAPTTSARCRPRRRSCPRQWDRRRLSRQRFASTTSDSTGLVVSLLFGVAAGVLSAGVALGIGCAKRGNKGVRSTLQPVPRFGKHSCALAQANLLTFLLLFSILCSPRPTSLPTSTPPGR